MINLACFALAALLTIFADGFEIDGIRMPSWIMMHITGHIMRPAAATLWMIATLYIIMRYQLRGIVVVVILTVACWIAWVIAVGESVIYEEEVGKNEANR